MRRPRAASAPLVAFALAALAHLTALLAGSAVATVTKPALMPLLAAHVLARGGPRTLAGALLLGCGGDTLLLIGGDTPFLLGMAFFAAGHVCYLLLCARHGTPGGRRTYGLGGVYAVAWLGTVALLWPDLEPGLRVPVALYSLLLTAMALGASRVRPRTGAGGLLFLASDTLIASGAADWPQPPVPQFWIMLGYLPAQLLLVDGLLRAAPRGPAGAEPPARAYGAVRTTP
ncbi:lysoplasmalogenase [Streptomyces albireticuli]|uniref:lysoplasmalogenase n=1 Tax=Streptomyces albireticuli TaxID=1940 RepID=UPI001E50A487|nr:lysoplasmalogenase [Streptomyces albireticuli]MCD9142347.1 lysoplasmalogenase [Streptomyces albireticuli]MCD9162399.1 lysoplasmalogenase [Streptomyces albireticuli]MCD9190521.1 lysoplasmalogenase [Streptomyces albireticuli]